MKLLVTKPITSNSHYYALSDTVETTVAQAGSFRRLYGWTIVEDDPADETSVAQLKKAELLDLAHTRGVEVPAKATKKDILILLGE